MIIIDFLSLYILYGQIITLLCTTVYLAQHYNSKILLYYGGLICFLCSIYLPIFLQYHSPWTEFANGLVNIFSAVTGILFGFKIVELLFTYEWDIQKQITIKQILVDFSTFPRYKYESKRLNLKSKPNLRKISNFVEYLILANDDDDSIKGISARQQNMLICIRGLFQLICLRTLLHLTPYSILRLHSQNSKWFCLTHFLIYATYGFIFYFSLGMVINIIFSIMGFIWNTHIRVICPAYPFFPTSLHDFWSRRWNIYVKSILHRIAFIALPKLTGFKDKSNCQMVSAGFFAFFLSGILHEFMYTVSMNRWSGGKYLVFFLLHGTFVGIELILKKTLNRKQLMSSIIGWIYTIALLYFTSHLFCDPWVEVDGFVTLKSYLG